VIEKALVEKDVAIATTYWNHWASLWSHIVQLSYIVYDTEAPETTKLFNTYIHLPPTVQIAAGASCITKVYKDKQDALEKGILCPEETPGIILLNTLPPESFMTISEALDEFMADFEKCEYIVGHNVDFDKKMILAECKRLHNTCAFEKILKKEGFSCTLMRTIDLCNLETKTATGRKYKKFPKLSESYKTLFGHEPLGESLHNALIDVVVCLRIFCRLGDPVDMDIIETHPEIMSLLRSISPPIKEQKKNKNKRRKRRFTPKKRSTKK
jgi:DNA polymerase III epsilon subunit-like protein